MSVNIKKEVAWLKEHAEQALDDVWNCKISGEPIMEKHIGRSHGSGEVVSVGHLYCPYCEPNKTFPQDGTPIDYENEVIELKEETSTTVV